MRVLFKAVRVDFFVADIGDTPVQDVIDELENGEDQTVTVETVTVDPKTPTDCVWDPRDGCMYDLDVMGTDPSSISPYESEEG